MSEYEYYEFRAVDRPLDDKQLRRLQRYSKLAEISAVGLTAVSSLGDFHRLPLTLMNEYYDAGLYMANFGTRRLMYRLPRTRLDPDVARTYCSTKAATLTETGDHVVVGLHTEQYSSDFWMGKRDRLAPMLQARADLAAGDLRLLYLAWLSGTQWPYEFVDLEAAENEVEPPVPAGLNELSPSLKEVVRFLEIDDDLLAVAAEASPSEAEARATARSATGRTAAGLRAAAEQRAEEREAR